MQEQIKYTKLTENTVAASGFKGDVPQTLDIPGKMKHAGKAYNVTEVADSAFSGKTTLQEVHMHDEMETIGSKAFAGCEKLEKVVFGVEGPIQIKDYAFAWSALKYFAVPHTLTSIGDYAFVGCSKLLYVDCDASVPPFITDKTFDAETLEKGLLVVRAADMDAYRNAEGWKLFKHMETRENEMERMKNSMLAAGGINIDIDGDDEDEDEREEPEDAIYTDLIVYQIINENEACVSSCNPNTIGSFEIPNTVDKGDKTYKVTCIDKGAFNDCDNLESIFLPENMEEVHPRAFLGCTGLTDFKVDPRNQHLADIDGVLCDKFRTIIISYPKGRKNTEFTVPASAMGIAAGCFTNSTFLQEVKLFDNLRFIGAECFFGCSHLRTMSLPFDLVEIGQGAFFCCDNLQSVYTLGGSPASLNDSFDKETLDRCTVYVARESLRAFLQSEGWQKFAKIRPATDFTDDATSYTYRQNGENTLTLAKAGKAVAGNIIIPKTVAIEGNAYHIDRIGANCFEECDKVTSITIQENIKDVGHQAFNACTALENVSLGEGVKLIENEAFRYCTSMRQLSIPQTVEAIGDGLTNGCENLEVIEVDPANPYYVAKDGVLYDRRGGLASYPAARPASTLEIAPMVSAINAVTFIDAIRLTAFEASQSRFFATVDGMLMTRDQKTLIAYPRGRKDDHPSVHGSVTTIGPRAFAASQFTHIDLPAGLQTIEMGAFYACGNLRGVSLPEGLTSIGNRAFLSCSQLSEVSIPSSVEKIEVGAFSYCQRLKAVKVPEKVTNLGNGVFMNCDSLAKIELPATLETIGDFTFANCVQLSQLTLPANLTSIGSCAFAGTFTEMGLLNSIMEKKDMTIAMLGTIPPVIADDTFDEYAYNKVILLVPTPALNAYRSAPGWCRFKLIEASDNVKKGIPVRAEYFQVGDFTYKVISEREVELARLEPDHKKASYDLPETIEHDGKSYVITRIGDFAFDEAYIVRLRIFAPVEVIGKYSFSNSHLLHILLPNTLREIGLGAFGGCEDLCDISLPASVTEIGIEAFAECHSLKAIAIPSRLEKLNYHTFHNCYKLEAVALGDGITTIEEGAFHNCRTLESVAFGQGLEEIAKGAFENCNSLWSLSMPQNLRLIGDNAFKNCHKLDSVILPESIAYIGTDAFEGCRSMSNLLITGTSDRLRVIDNVLYTADLTELLYCPCRTELPHVLVLPAQVKHIANSAFAGTNVEEIVLGENVTNIGDKCFADSSLSAINIPHKVNSIGEQAFASCKNLKSIELPRKVTHLAKGLFRSCKNLASVTIAGKIKEVETAAFKWCASLKTITIHGENCVMRKKCIDSCKTLEKVELTGIKTQEEDAIVKCENLKEQ